MKSTNPVIQAVIFDMDGLMFDTEDLFQEVECKIAEKRGKKFTLAIKNKMMGRKLADAIRIMKKELDLDEDPHVLFQEFDLLYQEVLRNEVQPRPGLFLLLRKVFHTKSDCHVFQKAMG